MIFNSLTFLVFAAIFFPIYFLTTGRQRLWVCLLGSYLFYGWWDWRFLALLMVTTLMDYTLGRLMIRNESEIFRKRMIFVSVTANLLVLGFFKYANFFIDSTEQVLRTFGLTPNMPLLHVLLPVGISFYTFQSMSYTIDIYRKEIEPERDFVRFSAFVSFFPQLVAGPIVRASNFLPQMRTDKSWNWTRFISGLSRILWGLFKKVAIADSLAPFVDQCFLAPTTFSSIQLLIGVIFYSFQIYCDFSGYSDIAIGLARILGFDFPENFRTPYFSQSFREFWTRWHISLSSWLRDYLYIPLGGSRKGKWKTYRNLLLTMLIGGLWHGANWAFLFWGLLHGLYQVIERQTAKPWARLLIWMHVPSWLRIGLNVVIVYSFTCLGWVYFRSGSSGIHSFKIANQVLSGISDFSTFNWSTVVNKFWVIKGGLLIVLLLSIEASNLRLHYVQITLRHPAFRVVSFVTLLWLLAFFGSFGSKSFIYFQF